MNTKRIRITFLTLLSWMPVLPALAQEQHRDDNDCNFNEQKQAERAARQALSDSMDLVHFVPAPALKTEACAIPAGPTVPVTFSVQPHKIYGFYPNVPNANLYLVVLSKPGVPAAKPVNGIRYKTGSDIGGGRVIAGNDATAFIAEGLEPGMSYRFDIYAGNSNCTGGIVYNPEPVYSAEKATSGTTVYNYYFGNLHSHSSYSDGNKDDVGMTPAEDYAFAKDADCMDFLGIAEHNHFSFPRNPGMHLADYHLGLQQAGEFTNDHPGFLALYGMEFGVISNGGHMVIYGIDSLLGWETIAGGPNYDIFVGKYDYTGLFNTINRFRSTYAFGYCAHPDDGDYNNLLNTPFRASADSALVGSALENGPAFSTEANYGDYPSAMSYLQYYKGLLAKGYHIGPTIDHDNHNLTFGRTARSRLVVLSPSLNKNDFLHAMRSRSFYATHSCSATLDFIVSGAGMGSITELAHEPAIAVSITDPSYAQTPSIRIYKGTNDGVPAVMIANGSGNTFTYTDNSLADGASAYYFADIKIGSQRTISAPVWYRRNDNAGTAIHDPAAGKAGEVLTILENPVKNDVLSYKITSGIVASAGLVQVADLYGRIIYQEEVVPDAKDKSISVSGLPAGTYVLRLLTGKGRSYAKFIKR